MLDTETNTEKEMLLTEHESGTITKERRARLHAILRREYKWGFPIPEYICKKCGKSISYTFGWDICCVYLINYGCGSPP